MRSININVELVYVTTSCCSLTQGIPRAQYDRCKRRGDEFYCCNCGAAQVFTTTENDKLKKQLKQTEDNLQRSKMQTSRALDQRNRVKRAHAKMRYRVKNGVCPCCNRSFESLWHHIRKEHPEFGDDKTLRQFREAYGMTQYDFAQEIGVDAGHISAFERDATVTQWAKDRIEAWMDDQYED